MVLKKSAQNSGKGDNTPVRTERCIRICVEASRWFFVLERLLFAFSCRNVTFVGCINKNKAVFDCCIDCGVCLSAEAFEFAACSVCVCCNLLKSAEKKSIRLYRTAAKRKA